jgi:diguanylate cyclase (GGDEF)-like protein
MRHGRYFIPYDTTPGAVPTISYVDVLEGSVDSDKVKDKYVLIGSTATGLGDVVSTPVSAEYQRMPGVELNAHILSGLLRDRLVTVLNPISCKLLTVSIAALAALMMVSTTFPVAMLLFITFTIGVLAFAGVLLIGWQQWFPPAAAIAPMILGFPLWGVWSLIQEKRTNQSLTVRMQHQALHHSATDLPNQYVLEENLRQLSAEPPDPGSVAALMIVHVKWPGSDGGMVSRSAGDQLLRAIAYRLSQTVRNDDLVAHLNGDDFGVLVKNLNDPEGALRVAQDIINALQRPVLANDKQIYLSPRMGLSLWPGESADGEALLRDAYIAMFRARVEQSSRTCVFSERIANEVQAHSRLEQALISAVERGEFEVYYQPQVLTRDGQIVGVEALLRWHNPKLGLVYPGTFIPVAEHNGLIGDIGNWVLRTACKQVHEWNQQHVGPLRLAVNLSPLQLSDANIVKLVKSALEDSGLPADLLELEVTESTLVHNMKETSSTLRKLKENGVQLAIDDFGTGYSALSNLQHFPLDRIKIDQSFTREIEANGNVREITLTIINMAKRLELEVIAEGVETESQAVFLSQSGCDELQGFYFGHPLPASKITSLLHERTFLRGDSAREHADDDSLRRGA